MPETESLNKRGATTLVISVLLHAALIMFLPGMGTTMSLSPTGNDNAIPISIVQASTGNGTQNTPGAKGSVVQAKTAKPEKPSSSPVVTKAKVVEYKAVTTVKTSPKPTARPVTPPVKAATAAQKDVTPARVLTSSAGIESAHTAPADSVPVPANDTASKAGPSGTGQARSEEPGESAPPMAGSVVSGFGSRPRLSGKETELLSEIVRLRVVATVPPSGPITSRLQSPSNNKALDSLERLAVYWVNSQRYMEFQRVAKTTYEVSVDVIVDPETNSVSFQLATPKEQVRVLKS